MMTARTLAWAQLFLQDDAFDAAAAPSAFITFHRESLASVLEKCPASEPILASPSLPVIDPLAPEYRSWRGQLNSILDALPENAHTAADDLGLLARQAPRSTHAAILTLYHIPRESPDRVFARCAGRLPRKSHGKGRIGKDTFIGVLEAG